MQIHRPDYWFRDPALDQAATTSMAAILPRVGERVAVGFAPYTELRTGAVETLLWRPPYTELNGWVSQPSEIAQSYLFVARVIKVATSLAQRDLFYDVYRHDIEILSCQPFLTALHGLHDNGKRTSPALVSTTYGPSLLWEDVHWCGTAAIDGLIFVMGIADQSFMELIAEDVDGALFGLFIGNSDPGGASYYLERRKLDQREQKTIRQVIEKAQQLTDVVPEYLIE